MVLLPCSPCCGSLPECKGVFPDFHLVSGDAVLFPSPASDVPFVAASTPGGWYYPGESFVADEDLPPQFYADIQLETSAASVWKLGEGSIEARFWCDENGDGAALTARLTIQHGQIILNNSQVAGNDQGFMNAPLSTHTLTERKFYPGGFISDALPVGILLEVLGPNGDTVSQQAVSLSFANMLSLYGGSTSTLNFVNVRFHACHSDGVITSWCVISPAGSPSSVAVIPPVAVVPEFTQAAVAMTNANGVVGTVEIQKFPAFPMVANCIPADLSFTSDGTDPRRWPMHVSNCTTVEQASRVRGASCSISPSSLEIQIVGIPILNGTYELGPVSGYGSGLADGQFWYEDAPGTVLQGSTLTRLEISAHCKAGNGVSVSWPPVSLIELCISYVVANTVITRRNTAAFSWLAGPGFLFGDPVRLGNEIRFYQGRGAFFPGVSTVYTQIQFLPTQGVFARLV